MRALRYREFRLLWFGLIMQGSAAWIHQVASGWLVLELTNSPLMLGLNSVSQAVPFVIVSLFGGALADRMDRRRLMIVSLWIIVPLSLVPAVLSGLNVIQVWHIYLINFAIAAVGGLESPARLALIPALVPRHELMSATALTSVIRRGTALIGPMVGGTAIALTGVTGAFVLDAVFNCGMLCATILLNPPKENLESRGKSFRRSIVDGIGYVRADPVILGAMAVEIVTMMLAVYVHLLPVFARDVLNVGPTGLGMLYAAPGVGAVLASAWMVFLGDVTNKGRWYAATAAIKPAALAAFAYSGSLPLAMLMLGVVGFLDVVGGTVRLAMLQLVTVERMRGRVMSLDHLIHRGIGSFSGLSLGAMASIVGAPLAVAAGAAITTAYAIYQFVRTPALPNYRSDEPEPSLVGRRP